MGNDSMKRPGKPSSSGKSSGKVHATGHGLGLGGKPVGHSGGYSGGSMKKPSSSGSSHSSSHSSSSGSHGSHSSGGSTNRAGLGGSLLSALLPTLLSGVASSAANNSGSSVNNGGLLSSLLGGKSKKSCLSRIITIILIAVVAYFLLKSCGVLNSVDVNSLFSTNSLFDSLSVSGNEASYSGLDDLSTSSEGYEEYNSFTAETGSLGNRTKRTNILGGGKDVYTVMVYMCGTDLESKYGMATADIKEMIAAKPGDKLNVIIETGGAKKWQNSTVTANKIQRFKVTAKGIQKLETLEDASMTNPNTLSSFIKYCAKNYKANRYALIFWDHGGGSVSGFGYDETESGHDSMTLDEIYTALENGGVNFDFVGFDACLMGTVETAYALNYRSDYMIASEETEPGIGWYYTNWMSALSKDTSMPTTTIGKNIIDDFVAKCQSNARNDKATLSLIDLVDFNNITDPAIKNFSNNSSTQLDGNNYKTLACARGAAKEFGSGSYDQVDLMDVANRMNTNDSKALVSALKKCIKYNKTSSNISNANGLSIYFPYKQLRSMSSSLKMYDKIGVCKEYRTMTKKFANLVLGGKIAASGSSSSSSGGLDFSDLLGSFLGSSSSSSSSSSGFDLSSLTSLLTGRGMGNVTLSDSDVDWIDPEYIASHEDTYTAEKLLNPSRIKISKKKGVNVLSLTKAEWELVSDVQEQIFIYDEDNDFFIDLGMDAPSYRFLTDEKLDLYAGFDGSWITIDGQPFCVYLDSYDEFGDNWQYTYRLPALLDTNLEQLGGKLADSAIKVEGTEKATIPVYLYLVRNNTTGDNYSIAYAEPIYMENETDTQNKTIQLKNGDVLYPICDCYDENYNFIDTYLMGENGQGTKFTVSNNNKLCRLDLSGNYTWYSRFCVTDIYGNEYWTENITNAQ